MSSPRQIARAWHILESRETARALHARDLTYAPEAVFYSVRDAQRHMQMNRYINILPYDRTIANSGDEYVNANVVVDPSGRWWVAAQAPVPENIGAFFRTILYRRASMSPNVPAATDMHPPQDALLVQLTGWTERGKLKADRYMPQGVGEEHALKFDALTGHARVLLQRQEPRPELGATYSHLHLSDDDAQMSVHHYMFGGWPDNGVPEGEAVDHMLALVREVRHRAAHLKCEVWVHCSAGVGRTGTFIMLSSMLDDPPAPDSPPPIEIASPLGPIPDEHEVGQVARAIDAFREYRCSLVQSPPQFQLLCKVLEGGE